MRDETIIDAEHETFRPRRRKLWVGLALCVILLFVLYAWVMPGSDGTAENSDSDKHAAFLKKRATFEETKKLAEKRIAPAPSAKKEETVSVQNVLDAVKEMAPAAPPATNEREEALQKEVEQLKSELAAMRDAPSSPASNAEAQTIAQLQQAVLMMSREVAELKHEMLEMKQAGPQNSLFVDFYLLEREAQAGNPFTNEFDALMLRTDLPDAARALISDLADARESGIPTREQIENAFHDTTERYFRGQAVPAKDANLWQRIQQNLKGLVVVRKVGADQEGMDPSAILARAEAAINQHDITSAEQEIRTLPKDVRDAFSDWLQLVEDRVEPLSQLEQARMILLAPDAAQEEPTAAPEIEIIEPAPGEVTVPAEQEAPREELRSPTPAEPLPTTDGVSQPL